MTIRPLDMQIIIPRATDVGKNQQVTDQQNTLLQQHFAEQWQQIADKRQQQVQNVPKGEHGKVQKEKHAKEQHEQSDNNEKKREQSPDSKDTEEVCKDPVRGIHIDIKT